MFLREAAHVRAWVSVVRVCAAVRALFLSLSLTLTLTLTLPLTLILTFTLLLPPSLTHSLTLSLFLSDVDMRSPVSGSREMCVAGQQTGSQPPHTSRNKHCCLSEETKIHHCRCGSTTLTREPTQNLRHEARNAPSPAFHWHLFCATAFQPTVRGSSPRAKRVHPYARSRQDTQRHALNPHQHLVHKIAAIKTGKMPRETVFCAKIQIN